jgi:hypothetical protein
MVTNGEQRQGTDEGAQVIASYKKCRLQSINLSPDEQQQWQKQFYRSFLPEHENGASVHTEWRKIANSKQRITMNREGSLSLYSDVLTSGRKKTEADKYWSG